MHARCVHEHVAHELRHALHSRDVLQTCVRHAFPLPSPPPSVSVSELVFVDVDVYHSPRASFSQSGRTDGMVARRLASLLRPLAEALRVPELDDPTVLRDYPRSSAKVLQKELEVVYRLLGGFSLVSSLTQRSTLPECFSTLYVFCVLVSDVSPDLSVPAFHNKRVPEDGRQLTSVQQVSADLSACAAETVSEPTSGGSEGVAGGHFEATPCGTKGSAEEFVARVGSVVKEMATPVELAVKGRWIKKELTDQTSQRRAPFCSMVTHQSYSQFLILTPTTPQYP